MQKDNFIDKSQLAASFYKSKSDDQKQQIKIQLIHEMTYKQKFIGSHYRYLFTGPANSVHTVSPQC